MRNRNAIVWLMVIVGCGGSFTSSDTTIDASAGGAGQIGTGGGSGVGGANGGSAGSATGSGAGGSAMGGSGGVSAGAGGAQGGMGGTAMAGAAGTLDAGLLRDAGVCEPKCGVGRSCCGGRCINPSNDPNNCGACGTRCQGTTPYCDGTCKPLPCEVNSEAGSCSAATSCCGTRCCPHGDICCKNEGPQSGAPQCYTPTADQPTCPQGCAPLCVSDRNLKRDIEPVDALSVLETVSRLPVSTWSYRTDADGIRHMGPMAQDFKEAFGLGDTDRGYYSIDAHGVSLAAIQALYERSLRQSLRIDGLERDNANLQQRLEALERADRR
jgi:Chaperone of endosialidase/Stigma-specific protein, Stig1